jgi:hypothetical protein
MNPLIFETNLQGIFAYNDAVRTQGAIKSSFPIKEDSASSKIIKYLLKNGESEGNEIKKNLSLDRSPSSFVRKHIEGKRILIRKIGRNASMYKIAPEYKLNDFQLRGSHDGKNTL